MDVTIIPASAANQGCTASCDVFASGEMPGDIEGWWRTYKASATSKRRWRFFRFEFDWQETDSESGPSSGTSSDSSNPTADLPTPSYTRGSLEEYNATYPGESHRVYTRTITAVRALFRHEGHGEIVRGSGGSILKGASGSVLRADGFTPS